jgi:hypothetical protein
MESAGAASFLIADASVDAPSGEWKTALTMVLLLKL